MPGVFNADADLIRAAGSRVTELADGLQGLDRSAILAGRDAYQCPVVRDAASTAADRWAYAVEQIAAELAGHGAALIASANRYDEVDLDAACYLNDPGLAP
ncbi:MULTISPECIES: hypothetical protein [unclassified Actinotalea]|uniref:hypothetical protein n=1 Tax=unclassified Actinotalea TaxID=2638618 RepID=UPI0015F54EB6|nr:MULTISPECIES: hypothetical protein [unclassified Actinotalea]